MSGLPDLAADPRTIRVRKRPDPLQVEFASTAGVCKTLEGPVRYRAGDAILTGSQREQWPVRRDLFLASYEPVPPTGPGQSGTYRKLPSVTLALRLDDPVEVPVGWQDDPLLGRPGDWLLRYADGSHGIVQDAIFRASYVPATSATAGQPE